MSLNVDPTSLRGHTVVLTGKVLGIGRGQMHAIIASAGGAASDRIDTHTTLLVAENPGGQTFRKVLEGHLAIQVAVHSHSVGSSAPSPAPADPTPPKKPKPDKRAQRQRDAATRQLEQLASKPPSGPYGIGF